jgi:hypothetical protein
VTGGEGLAETVTGVAARPAPRFAVGRLTLITAALAVFILWMPLQTPVSLIAYQYGHSLFLARALLLVKDFAAAALILLLFAGYWRRIRLYWFDWAAIVYVACLVVYSIVPWLLGSDLSLLSVIASAREYVLPAELYGLGRLAVAAGVDVRFLVSWFLGVAAAAAAFTVFEYVVLPSTFWSSTMNMVDFVRIVQGVPGANSLGSISVLANYGTTRATVFTRAIGPFTQPVGAAHYFVLPLILSIAWCFESINTGRYRRALRLVALTLLFAAAEITPISRGGWIAAGIALVLCALAYRRLAFSVAAVALTGAFLVFLRPSAYSITAALTATDSSTQQHAVAIDKGLRVVVENPLGLGVGQADQFGQAYSDAAGVGENTYLALFVTAGPLGLATFLVFVAGLLWRIAPSARRAPPPSWMLVGTVAAMIGYLAAAMTTSALMRFTTSATVWLIVGLGVAYVLAERARGAAAETAGAGSAEAAADSAGPA